MKTRPQAEPRFPSPAQEVSKISPDTLRAIQADADGVAALGRALSHPVRAMILATLLHSTLLRGESMAIVTRASKSSVSRHVAKLHAEKLICRNEPHRLAPSRLTAQSRASLLALLALVGQRARPLTDPAHRD